MLSSFCQHSSHLPQGAEQTYPERAWFSLACNCVLPLGTQGVLAQALLWGVHVRVAEGMLFFSKCDFAMKYLLEVTFIYRFT